MHGSGCGCLNDANRALLHVVLYQYTGHFHCSAPFQPYTESEMFSDVGGWTVSGTCSNCRRKSMHALNLLQFTLLPAFGVWRRT